MTIELISATVTASVAFVGLIAAHEWGHALAAHTCGAKVARIDAGNGPKASVKLFGVEHRFGLLPWSGQTMIPDLKALSTKKQMVVVFAGIAASVILGLALKVLAGDGESLLNDLGSASLAIAAFNLLPIPGLDGWALKNLIMGNKS